MPQVSVIIPVYNPGPYLVPAVESVLAQTVSDWELILVDDNSSEDISFIQQMSPKLKIIRQKHGGTSVARNNGILQSSGEYIAFMDQDDVWRPHKLERQIAAMESDTDVGVCYCDLELIDAEGKLMTGQSAEAKGGRPAQDFVVELDGTTMPAKTGGSNLHCSLSHFSSHFVVPSTVVLRRSCLATSGLLDPFIPFSGDYDLLIKLGGQHKVVHVPCVDVLYRKHSNNFSDQYEVGRREVNALIARYAAYAKSQNDRLLARNVKRLFSRSPKVYAAQAFDNARRSFGQRDYHSLARHLWRAFWFSPTFVLGSVSRWCLAVCLRKHPETT